MNSLNLVARLTRDAETRFTPSGKAITNFSVAFDVGWGEKKRAIFLECKIWGERGESLASLVRKGHRVALTGSLDQEEWTDKQTQEQKKKMVMSVSDFTLIERKKDDEPPQERRERPAQRTAARPAQSRQPAYNEPDASAPMEEEDIPF